MALNTRSYDENSGSFDTIDNLLRIEWRSLHWRDSDVRISNFITQLCQRESRFTALIRSSAGFETWTPDYSACSLELLGSWFERYAKLEVIPPEERHDVIWLHESLSREIREDISQRERMTIRWRLDRCWQLIAVDAAAYFGECVRSGLPACTWRRCRKRRTDSYNGPWIEYTPSVHRGFDVFGRVPTALMQIAEHDRPTDGLAELSNLASQEYRLANRGDR